MMNKFLWFHLVIIGLVFFACEEDNICVEVPTPQLYIELNGQSVTNSLDSLIIYQRDINNDFQLINESLILDSIKVPLSIEPNRNSIFVITDSYETDRLLDTLIVDYNLQVHYVSKACGYGVDYLDAKYQMTTNLFQSIEILQNDIKNEDSIHIRLNY